MIDFPLRSTKFEWIDLFQGAQADIPFNGNQPGIQPIFNPAVLWLADVKISFLLIGIHSKGLHF